MEQKLKRQKKGKNMPEWAFLREGQRVQRNGSEKAPCIQGNTSHSAWLEKTAKTWKAREAGLKRQAGRSCYTKDAWNLSCGLGKPVKIFQQGKGHN